MGDNDRGPREKIGKPRREPCVEYRNHVYMNYRLEMVVGQVPVAESKALMEPVNLVKLLHLCQWNQRPMWFTKSALVSHLLPLRKKKALAAFGRYHFGNSVQMEVCHQFNAFASV